MTEPSDKPLGWKASNFQSEASVAPFCDQLRLSKQQMFHNHSVDWWMATTYAHIFMVWNEPDALENQLNNRRSNALRRALQMSIEVVDWHSAYTPTQMLTHKENRQQLFIKLLHGTTLRKTLIPISSHVVVVKKTNTTSAICSLPGKKKPRSNFQENATHQIH